MFKSQKKIIENLNLENKKLRDQVDLLQREKTTSTIDAIKQMEEEVNKGIEKQREENGGLQEKLNASYKENSLLKEMIRQQQIAKQEEMGRMISENKKMKEYIDTLIRTRSDAPKVVAMEQMLKGMVTQLSKMTEKCSGLQLELNKKEQEAQRCHEVMQRFEQQSKSYEAAMKYLKTKSMIGNGDLTLRRTLEPKKDQKEGMFHKTKIVMFC